MTYDTLHDDLKKRGWTSGTHRGFLRQVRGGIEWEVGPGRSGRLEIRWQYKTLSGDEPLAENATRADLEDTMTSIYLRVHEKPDPTRVFGGGKRAVSRPAPSPAANPSTPATPKEPAPVTPEEAGQGSFDL